MAATAIATSHRCVSRLVTAAQLGISEELALIVVIGAAVVASLSFAVQPGPTSRAIRGALPGLFAAIGIMLLLASPLLVSQLFMAPTVTVDTTAFPRCSGGLRPCLDPSAVPAGHVDDDVPAGRAEHGVYLAGPSSWCWWPAWVTTFRRDRWIRVATAGAVVLAALCMYPVFHGVPALGSVMPARFSFALYLVVAWMFARWLDRLGVRRPAGLDRRGVTGLVAAAALTAALVSLVPRQVGSYPLPAAEAFFGSSWQESHLPRGSAVLLLPAGDARGMYAQQLADFTFVQPGGYALLPPARPANSGPGRLLVALSDQARYRPVTDPGLLASGRLALCELSLRAIVVSHSAAEFAGLDALATDLMRRAPDRDDGGVSVWLLSCPVR